MRMQLETGIACIWNCGHRRTVDKTANISVSTTQWTTNSCHKRWRMVRWRTRIHIKIYSFRTWFSNYSLSVRSTQPSTVTVDVVDVVCLPNILATFFVYIAHGTSFFFSIFSIENTSNTQAYVERFVLCASKRWEKKLDAWKKRRRSKCDTRFWRVCCYLMYDKIVWINRIRLVVAVRPFC